MWVWVGLVAVLGAAADSFLQVVLDRGGGGVPVARLRERSRCPRCTTVLLARDNLPVLGFGLLRGRCRACAVAIPSRHVFGELAGAAVWGMAAALLGLHWWLPAVLVAPAFAVSLLTARVRRAGVDWLLAASLPVIGVALVALAVGGALAGRWALFAGGGALAAAALFAAVLLADERPLRQRPAGA